MSKGPKKCLPQQHPLPKALPLPEGGDVINSPCCLSDSFTEAMKSQPKLEGLDSPWAYCSGLVILAVGTLFVISSFLALGFTGTFLGKHEKIRQPNLKVH